MLKIRDGNDIRKGNQGGMAKSKGCLRTDSEVTNIMKITKMKEQDVNLENSAEKVSRNHEQFLDKLYKLVYRIDSFKIICVLNNFQNSFQSVSQIGRRVRRQV